MTTANHNPANVETAPEKLYDLCMIEKLCRGNKEQEKQMIEVFIAQVPQAVEAIKLAYKRKDFVEIKKAAHKIKPVLGFYAIVKLEKDIRQIEAMAEGILAPGELGVKIDELDGVIANVVAQMKSTFQTNNKTHTL